MHPLLKVDIAQLSISERIQLAEDLWDSIVTENNTDEFPYLISKMLMVGTR